MLKSENTVPQEIREAINSFPGGLCFSMTNGRPILVNHQMNRLMSRLTGHTILDAEQTWKEISGLEEGNGCRRLHKPWTAEEKGQLEFSFPDGKIWRFRRTLLQDWDTDYIQLEASEITELYHLSEELFENNRRLIRLQERQKNLLHNIVQINREKELLSVKMRVHDEFGRCLIATKKALSEHTLTDEIGTISTAWENAIRDLSNIPLDEPKQENSPETELRQVAEMIGCRIVFTGERPTDRSALLLLYAAVREALTNAVRHAGADCLNVLIGRTDTEYHVEISDNGKTEVSTIQEGSGLSNLRKRLEQEGATLKVVCRGGVRLVLDLPADERGR